MYPIVVRIMDLKNDALWEWLMMEMWHDSKVLLLLSIRVSSYNITRWVRGRTTGNLKSSIQFKTKKINCGAKTLFEIDLKIS